MAADTTTLILAVHAHQPVGNFGWVFEEAYTKAYRPFLDVIERHSSLKWAFHVSGPLVDWLEHEHPDALRRLAALVRRGQAEVLSGGYAEPILPLIPERDAIGQVQRFTRQLTRRGLGPCRGAWLAERVWEPSLPRVLRAAGIEYTVVDDHHLTLAGLGPEAAFGYWITEDAGATVALFPSSKALRYLVPFQPVASVLEHLRAQRGPADRAVVLADDLEKFGLWPGTTRWVYDEGWLESFCQALEHARDWLRTYTFSQFLAAFPPRGRVYVPCASYEEMLQWSGGYFRNFLTKYPEANTLHKKMLWVSRRLEAARAATGAGRRAAALAEAQTHLYRGQGNDPYWHGVFGGIYLNHLRAAAWRELLAAERALDRAAAGARPWAAAEAEDGDADGRVDLRLCSGFMDVWVDPSRGGAIVEWSDKDRMVNLVNTLTRRPEPYHAKLREPALVPVAAQASAEGHTPVTIHAGVRIKEPVLAEHLVYDRYRRVAAVDHVWPAGTGDPQAFADGALPESPFLEHPYRWRVARDPEGAQAVLQRDGAVAFDGGAVPIRLTKTVLVARRHPRLCVTYTVLNVGNRPVPLRVGSEWNFALKDPHFNRVGVVLEALRLIFTDVHADVRVECEASRPCGCWYHPVETVSDSEAGVERTYQQVGTLLWWDVVAAPRRPWRVTLTYTVRPGGVHAPV